MTESSKSAPPQTWREKGEAVLSLANFPVDTRSLAAGNSSLFLFVCVIGGTEKGQIPGPASSGG